jgi:hypothetical protein
MAVAGWHDKAGEGPLYLIELDSLPIGTFMLTNKKIGFYRADWSV